jgi:predicted nucleotidyltransferase
MTTQEIPFNTLRVVAQNNIPNSIFATLSGAHLYGFPSPDSDYDLRGAHIGALEDVFGLFPKSQTLEPKIETDHLEIEIVSHEIGKYLRLMMKPNGYVLEQIYSPLVILSTPSHEELKQLARSLICRGLYHHYRGFLFSIRKLIDKEPVKKAKRILYLYRVILTGTHVLQTGELEMNLIKLNEHFGLGSIPHLIESKQQELSELPPHLQNYETELAQLEANMTRAYEASALPESPTGLEELSAFLTRLRREQLSAM